MIVSVFSAELGSSADTCTASVYEAFSRGSHIFYMKVDSVTVFSTGWFDSGYKAASVHGVLLHFSAMLG